jgi:hypothetical protein
VAVRRQMVKTNDNLYLYRYQTALYKRYHGILFSAKTNTYSGGGSGSVHGNLQRKSGAFQIPVAEENMKEGRRSIYYLMVYDLRSFKHEAPYVLYCQVG